MNTNNGVKWTRFIVPKRVEQIKTNGTSGASPDIRSRLKSLYTQYSSVINALPSGSGFVAETTLQKTDSGLT